MENTNSSLAHRQVEVIRNNLLSVFRFAVKALIDKACFSSIDDGCEEFINFCATMEHILQHRLRPSKAWYLGDDRSHFWFYIKTACHRQDLRGCITNIDNIENIKSPVAKGRAFVRCALMEKRLSEYLGEALKQTNITRRFYKPGAIMLGEEATELCGVLLGLNSIDFGFCLKGENYDTVECPLAISYTPFMKFKQSQESLHSDLEEMRELSCGSSLASEDGHDAQDTPPSDTWSDRYNSLHKRYMRVLEQKSFLEEVTASQEKALQTAAATQQEVCRMQRDAAFQKRQYEGVILELQAQVARMKTINETLQHQLTLARSTRLPMSEMDRRGERSGEATRFAAAMVYKQESDRHSLTSSFDRSSVGGGRAGGDTRSLTSALSEISVDVVGQGQGTSRMGEDTQSMVPLTGSLGDLHLDLETGVAVTESTTTITNPEQATPVVSISSGAYAGAFAEINGNHSEEGNVLLRGTSQQDASGVQVSSSGEGAGDHGLGGSEPRPNQQNEGDRLGQNEEQLSASQQNTSASQPVSKNEEASGQDLGDETARKEIAGEGGADALSQDAQNPMPMHSSQEISRMEMSIEAPSGDLSQGGEDRSDNMSEDSRTSEPEELVPENGTTAAERESSASEHDSSDPEVLSAMTSSKESVLSSSDREDTSEPEVLSHEALPHDALSQEPLSQEDNATSTEAAASESSIRKQEGDTNLEDPTSSDREETSEPEILTQEEDKSHSETTDQASESGPEHAPKHADSASGSQQPQLTGPGPSEDNDASGGKPPFHKEVTKHDKGEDSSEKPAEQQEKESGSDSGSSDDNKDAWDMLSDANHDSS